MPPNTPPSRTDDAALRLPAVAELAASARTPAHLAPAIRAEHERWDGSGYPDRLAGEAIPIISRIVFVCDAIQAMTSDRPYRRAMSRTQAVNEVRRGAGTQFCPSVVGAALQLLAAPRPGDSFLG